MKKILSVLLALSLLVGVVLLSSCEAFGKKDKEKSNALKDTYGLADADFKEIVNKLESLGYYVDYRNGDAETGVVEMLDAWHNNDDLQVSSGWGRVSIARLEKEKTAELYYNTLKAEYDGEIAMLEAEIELYEHLLNDFADQLSEEETVAYREERNDLKEELMRLKDEIDLGYYGTLVWYGNRSVLESIGTSGSSANKKPGNSDSISPSYSEEPGWQTAAPNASAPQEERPSYTVEYRPTEEYPTEEYPTAKDPVENPPVDTYAPDPWGGSTSPDASVSTSGLHFEAATTVVPVAPSYSDSYISTGEAAPDDGRR